MSLQKAMKQMQKAEKMYGTISRLKLKEISLRRGLNFKKKPDMKKNRGI